MSCYEYNKQPIAQSPFSGSDKQAKIDYCRRQINLLKRWWDQTDNVFFHKCAIKWKVKLLQINAGKL